MDQAKIDQLAQTIWDYHLLNHKLKKSDVILALGSHDTRVAERAAELYLNGYAPILIFSGGLGRLTQGIWQKPEAEIFYELAIQMGVPKEKILIENKSSNTGENIQFTYKLIKENNLDIKKVILVQKPYMERRTYATFKKQWPNKDMKISVTSPQFNFNEYCNEQYPKDKILAILLGDLERIKYYPQKGFQIHQKIPANVWNAYQELLPIVKSGPYSKYLIDPKNL